MLAPKFLFTIALFGTAAQACYQTCTSSTAGKFSVIHSEPKDHGGTAQYVTWTHGSCTGKAQVLDGCSLIIGKTSGCGTLKCTGCPNERPC